MQLSDLSPLDLPSGLELPNEVFIGVAALTELPAVSQRHAGDTPLVVADPDTWRAVSSSAEPQTVAADRLLMLDPHPRADRETVARVAQAASGRSGLLAVGSGTINDLVKMAATELGLPYVAVGTAASMNGYASGIAAILEDGGKTTTPARPPQAIVLDVDVLRMAPPALWRAGLGDLLSKPVSEADWWLGAQLEGSRFDPRAGAIAEAAVTEASAHAADLPSRTPAAHQALARAVVLSGVSMVVAGSSAPASGGEHLISHLWDMEAVAANQPHALHGAQVGVASCVSAALYAEILRVETLSLPPEQPWETEAARIGKELGELAKFALPRARDKHRRAGARRAALLSRWPTVRAGLASMKIPSPTDLLSPLLAAGAPTTLREIGRTPDDARHALRCARDIRDRYTVLDLGHELGVLPGSIDSVLNAAGV